MAVSPVVWTATTPIARIRSQEIQSVGSRDGAATGDLRTGVETALIESEC